VGGAISRCPKELKSEVLGCRMDGRKLKLATFSTDVRDGERASPLAYCGGKEEGEGMAQS
jgi:hypothetical protein